MTDLFERVLLPVAGREDATATCRALAEYDLGAVVAVNVIEKADGAPDKAGVEQREHEAEAAFEEIEACLNDVTTEIHYGTGVADTIFAAAAEHDSSCIAFTPRGGNRFVQLLTGDVAHHLMTGSDRPVVVLPDPERDSDVDEVLDQVDEAGDDG